MAVSVRPGLAAAALVFAAVALSACQPIHGGPSVPLFGDSEISEPYPGYFPKWTEALERYAREKPLEDAACQGRDCPLQTWKALLAELKAQPRLVQLQRVNAFVNRTGFQADAERFGLVDHWATPAEFLGRSGDCEDFAVAKYISLRRLGWSPDQLRLIVLAGRYSPGIHAVLAVRHDGATYALDNQADDLSAVRVEATFRPVFALNEARWFYYPGPETAAPDIAPAQGR